MSDTFPSVNHEAEEDGLLLNEEQKKNSSSLFVNHWKILLSGFGVVFLILLGVVIGAVFSGHSSSDSVFRPARGEKFPYSDIRLPGNVIPIKYRIYLHPNITDGKFGFTGNVRILVEIKNETESIILHSKKLKIQNVAVFKEEDAMNAKKERNSEKLGVKDFILQKKLEFIMIRFKDGISLKSNMKFVIYIQFAGSLLTSGLEGFYRSSYKTKAGETRYLATTHFEATSARTAFPCFDEPAMKANFSVKIVREKNHTALSNMPIGATFERHDGLVVDHFNESVKMSTYLVAFVVCDYAYKEATTKGGVKVRVWAPKEQIEQANFAIKAAPIVLDYYDEFFKVKFPLPKQDLIAIPDFAAGAMENWGLITYRLTSILYDEKESSSANKQWVAVVIAHELAHQWFGNLVTMKWWNDLWLNEGFAAFVEFIGANVTEPSWQMMDQFIVDDTQASLTLDSHANSHPISVKVHDPAQINEIFDTISYDKGASIIRMMKHFIGSNAFHTGLSDYLKKYQYSNAVSDDLWACLTAAAKANGKTTDVKAVMDTWTLQMGYPVINVKRDPNDNEMALATQKHFLIDVDADVKKSPYNYKWDVPITYYTEHKYKTTDKKLTWFNRTSENIKFPWSNQGGWLKLNTDQIGFYRVNYDAENWKALSDQLLKDHKVLSTSDRANIIDDAFELAKANQLSLVKALDITAYLKKEREYVPWITAMGSLAYIGDLLQLRPGYRYYEKYVVRQVKPIVKILGWKDEGSHLDKYLRGAALRSAVAHNDTDARANATKLFNDFMLNKKAIPPNLRSVAYLAGIKYGSAKNWDFMYKIYESTQFPSEQRKIMFALTDTVDKDILKKYLSWTLDDSKIRSQDSCGVIEHIAINPVGTEMAQKFVMKHWDTIYKRYGSGSFDMSSLIKTIFGRLKTLKDKEKAKQFLETHKLGSGKLAGKQALAAIKNHIAWLDTNEDDVVAWLKKKLKE